MSITVIIPALDAPLLCEVVAALAAQRGAALISEVIVVGRHHGPALVPAPRMIVTAQPLAAAAARNLGAQLATSPYLLFLDADCLPSPDCVARIHTRLEEGAAVVGGSIALESGAYWRLCDNLLAFTPFLSTASAGARPYLPSFALALRRDRFAELGGFDQHYPGAAGEDLDLSVRLRKAGATLIFEPQAWVWHRPPRTTARRIAAHLRGYGRAHARVQRIHGAQAAPRFRQQLHLFSGLIMACAPLLALADMLALLGRNPALRRYWACLPGLVWGKSAWYWGLSEGLLAGSAAATAQHRARV